MVLALGIASIDSEHPFGRPIVADSHLVPGWLLAERDLIRPNGHAGVVERQRAALFFDDDAVGGKNVADRRYGRSADGWCRDPRSGKRRVASWSEAECGDEQRKNHGQMRTTP